MKPTSTRLCPECLLDLATVSPRRLITIDSSAKMATGKNPSSLFGTYCSVKCALNAYERGIPKHG